MSRGYRIRMRAPVSTRQGAARAADALTMDIDLLPILDAAEMQGLLAGVLAEAGWTEVDGTLQTQIDGATVRLEGDHLSITAAATKTVTGQGATAGAASSQMKARQQIVEAELEAQVRRTVSKVEATLCEALEPAVQAVYIEALKRKAAKMGEVLSVDERRDGDQVELTIKVKV